MSLYSATLLTIPALETLLGLGMLAQIQLHGSRTISVSSYSSTGSNATGREDLDSAKSLQFLAFRPAVAAVIWERYCGVVQDFPGFLDDHLELAVLHVESREGAATDDDAEWAAGQDPTSILGPPTGLYPGRAASQNPTPKPWTPDWAVPGQAAGRNPTFIFGPPTGLYPRQAAGQDPAPILEPPAGLYLPAAWFNPLPGLQPPVGPYPWQAVANHRRDLGY
ncbi:MAG: hypothetical protein M1826_007085 [Phylliscum demangeonii]|nr:MAG: hypothetical protein M1826_007085 [Phylliscum demangeonii]